MQKLLYGLALFRIAWCLCLAFYLLGWWQEFSFFFTARNPLPLALSVSQVPGGDIAWSLYNGSSYRLYPYLLFLLTAASGLFLAVGWRAQVSSFGLFALLLSLQNRASIALTSSDALLLGFLLLGILTPWDRALALSPSKPRPGWLTVTMLVTVTIFMTGLAIAPESRPFWGLGPSAPKLSPHTGIALVGTDEHGISETLLELGQVPSQNSSETLSNKPGYRQSLYLSALTHQSHDKLAQRLVLLTYQQKSGKFQDIILYRYLSNAEGVSRTVLGQWPPSPPPK